MTIMFDPNIGQTSGSLRLAAYRTRAADDPDDDEIPDRSEEVSGDATPHPATRSNSMNEQDNKAAIAAAYAKARNDSFKAGYERMAAVFASEHHLGREALAAKLLGNTSLSAAEIVGRLADLPKSSGASGASGAQSRDAQALWDKVIAKNFGGAK